jgi:ABC-type branched-subunit amino acid transport system substrate-binding protein
VNANQITGPLAAVAPLLTAALVAWGMDDNSAGLIAGGIVMLLAGAFSLYSNRSAALAQQLVKHDDVKVEVGPMASSGLQALAVDPAVPGVVVATPRR